MAEPTISGSTSAAAGVFLRGLKRLRVGFVRGGINFAAIMEAHRRHRAEMAKGLRGVDWPWPIWSGLCEVGSAISLRQRMPGDRQNKLAACAFLRSVFFASVLVSACAVHAQDLRKYISIGTGGLGGMYNTVGSALCGIVNADSEGRMSRSDRLALRCLSPYTGGSIYNLKKLSVGALNFALVQSDWQYNAFSGATPQAIPSMPHLRSLFSVYAEPFHLVTAKGAAIGKFTDLKGKRVDLGSPGTGYRATMQVLMTAYGMTAGDFASTTELTASEQAAALCAGEIDAYPTVIGLGSRVVSAATGECGAKIVALDTSVEQSLITDQPYYEIMAIPEGTYETADADIQTLAVMATVVTVEDLDDEIVYEFVRAVMEQIDALRTRHPVLSGLVPQRMIRDGLTAPLHPGALRYYQERGWM